MRQSNRVLLFAIASAVLVSAQTDPPGRVGRLSYMNGAVSFRPGDIEDWVAADVNRPLTTGDHLWIDEGARAELNIGTAALRLNSRTAFEFLNLDDGNTQIRLTEGSLNIRVRSLDQNETFEIDTPNLAFSVLRTGEYRIDVNPDTQTTRITVRGGEGEVTGGGQAFTVHAREQADVSGEDSLSYNVLNAPRPDEWDNWCDARDRREDQSQSARYVSREMVGYQDLDDYGDWRTEPEYGAVWVPRRVAADWAPYHYGHWVWVEPWGWTWVDDAPWGFAPFHYGRWAYVRGYWGWIPGPVAVRPVYAPALVAWVGGSRFSLAISVGGGPGIGWFPLGPREVFVPGYRASPRYVNRVNVTNTTITNINITNVYNTTNVRYVNREAPGAVMVVRQNAFGSRRVQDGAVRVRPEDMRSAEVMNGAPIAPRRENVLGNSGAGGGRVAQPPAAAFSRTVVAKTTPPPPQVPFSQRQGALSANPGRPVDAAEIERMRGRQDNPRPFVRSAQGMPNNGGGMNGRPGGQPPPQQNSLPPVRNDRTGRDVNPGGQPPNNPPPARDGRDFQRGRENPGGQPPPTPQNSLPPVRNDRTGRDVNPGGQSPNNPPPARDGLPPVRNDRTGRDVNPGGQPPNNPPPARDDRNFQRGRENPGGQPPPQQNNVPPVRNDRTGRDVNPGGQPPNNPPPARDGRDFQRGRENPGGQPPPQQNNVPPVRNDRPSRDVNPGGQPPPAAPPPHVQRDVPQRVAPPERPAEQPRPPQRQVEQARPERQAPPPKEEKKEEKKDEKKDEKKKQL